MAAVTYIPRLLPLWLLTVKPLPPLVVSWLRYVPVAVLSAMLLPDLLLVEGALDFSARNLFLWAAFPTLLVAWKTRSLFGSVTVGMLLVALARYWGG